MAKRVKDHTKILLLGDSEVGKTSVMHQYCDQVFSCNVKSTVGVDFRMKNVTIDGTTMRLQIWDTAGQERFRSIGKAYYRGSEGIVVVFDLTRRESFEHVDEWISSIRSTVDDSDIPLLLLANKKDLKEARVVDPQLVEALAKEHNIPYYEVSALTGENIEESLTEFAKGIYQQKQKKRESTTDALVLSESVREESEAKKEGGCCS
jgi:small GTP-binding protein